MQIWAVLRARCLQTQGFRNYETVTTIKEALKTFATISDGQNIVLCEWISIYQMSFGGRQFNAVPYIRMYRGVRGRHQRRGLFLAYLLTNYTS